jgi:benzaldehyde dehydrogenase (NAD)
VAGEALDRRGAVAPFGGVGASGTGSRHGGPQADIEALAFTGIQWVTLRGDLPACPLWCQGF